MKLKQSLFILSFFFVFHGCHGQQKSAVWINKFDQAFFDNSAKRDVFNYRRYLDYSKSGDARNFIALSYAINALNIMFRTTKDIRYLLLNDTLVENIISSSVDVPYSWNKNFQSKSVNSAKSGSSSHRFRAWVVKSDAPSHVIGRDWQLYEGYLYRYIAQYLYILKNSDFINENENLQNSYYKILDFVENNVWYKWEERSLNKFGDFRGFYTVRTHMGSHWAAIALYLDRLTDRPNRSKIYKEVIDTYDTLLKNNFQLIISNGYKCYIWHATYDLLPHNARLNEILKYKGQSRWQDLSHGNQVVSYVLAAYELGDSSWKKSDIMCLINTAKFINWKPKEKDFKDTFKGRSEIKELRNIGWKQSDGWMKLACYDDDLEKIYEEFYMAHKDRIDHSFLGIQFWAQFAYNLSKNN